MVWLRYWYRYGDYAKMTERLGMVSINIDKGVTTMVRKKAQGSGLKKSVLKWFENTKRGWVCLEGLLHGSESSIELGEWQDERRELSEGVCGVPWIDEC